MLLVVPLHVIMDTMSMLTLNLLLLLLLPLQERDMCSEPAATNEFALQLHRVHLGDLVGAPKQPAPCQQQQQQQCLVPAV
jgi:hypothetical protein